MKSIILSFVFIGMFMLAFYGNLIEQNEQDSVAGYLHHNIFQWGALGIALPGNIIVTLIMNPTDIPERGPEPWSTRWFTAPVNATGWTFVFGSLLAFARYRRKRARVT